MTQKLKKADFFLVTESFLYIESCVMPLLKALIKGFISFLLHLRLLSNLCGRYDPKTKQKDVFPCNGVISSSRIMYKAFIFKLSPRASFLLVHR